jgi:cytochrome c-type biogenesis protein CcmE
MTATSAPASLEQTSPESQSERSPFLRAPVLVPVVVIVAAIVYLVITALGTTTAYYMTVSELRASGANVYGQPVRVAGNVVAGSIQRDPTGFEVRFDAADESGVLPIVYRGVLPDIFGDGVEVVVEGKYAADGLFTAGTLLAKCPSKFET